jgi:hypothetical protein
VSGDIAMQLGQLGTLLIACLAIGVALTNQQRQINAQMFIEVSRRFQELLRMFPTDAWLANRNPAQEMPPSSQEIRDCTLYAMQLVSSVYYLHRHGFVSKRLWMLWELEIKHTITGPVFRREWRTLEAEFAYDGDFLQYVNAFTQGAEHGQQSSFRASAS